MKVLTPCATAVGALEQCAVLQEKRDVAILATTAAASDLRVANAAHAVLEDALATLITFVVVAETATSCGTADAALAASLLTCSLQPRLMATKRLSGRTLSATSS